MKIINFFLDNVITCKFYIHVRIFTHMSFLLLCFALHAYVSFTNKADLHSRKYVCLNKIFSEQ